MCTLCSSTTPTTVAAEATSPASANDSLPSLARRPHEDDGEQTFPLIFVDADDRCRRIEASYDQDIPGVEFGLIFYSKKGLEHSVGGRKRQHVVTVLFLRVVAPTDVTSTSSKLPTTTSTGYLVRDVEVLRAVVRAISGVDAPMYDAGIHTFRTDVDHVPDVEEPSPLDPEDLTSLDNIYHLHFVYVPTGIKLLDPEEAGYRLGGDDKCWGVHVQSSTEQSPVGLDLAAYAAAQVGDEAPTFIRECIMQPLRNRSALDGQNTTMGPTDVSLRLVGPILSASSMLDGDRPRLRQVVASLLDGDEDMPATTPAKWTLSHTYVQPQGWPKSGDVYVRSCLRFLPDYPFSSDNAVLNPSKAVQYVSSRTPPPLPTTKEPTFLAKQTPHSRDRRIRFEEVGHKYFVQFQTGANVGTNSNSGPRFESAYVKSTSGFVHNFFPTFDADEAIRKMRQGRNWCRDHPLFGLSNSEIKAAWTANGAQASAWGTRMHALLEFAMNGERVRWSHGLLPEVRAFVDWRRNYFCREKLLPFRTEMRFFTDADSPTKPGPRITGMADLLAVRLDHPSPEVTGGVLELHLLDWKFSKEIKTQNRYARGFGPCKDLDDCNYNHYLLQQMTYLYMCEQFYGNWTWRGHTYARVRVVSAALIVFHENHDPYLQCILPRRVDLVRRMLMVRRREVERMMLKVPPIPPPTLPSAPDLGKYEELAPNIVGITQTYEASQKSNGDQKLAPIFQPSSHGGPRARVNGRKRKSQSSQNTAEGGTGAAKESTKSLSPTDDIHIATLAYGERNVKHHVYFPSITDRRTSTGRSQLRAPFVTVPCDCDHGRGCSIHELAVNFYKHVVQPQPHTLHMDIEDRFMQLLLTCTTKKKAKCLQRIYSAWSP